MERRQILLGTGAIIATAFAGCTSNGSGGKAGTADHTESDDQDDKNGHTDKKDSANKNEKDKKESEQDEKAESDRDDEEKKTEREAIPGFDRENFKIDSDVIEVKKLAYRDQRLDIRVMVTSTDQDILAEELRALGPAFERAIRDSDGDVEEFFAEVHQIKFTLYDEHKNTVFAIFLDLQWLRDLLNDEMSDEEFADRICEQMPQA